MKIESNKKTSAHTGGIRFNITQGNNASLDEGIINVVIQAKLQCDKLYIIRKEPFIYYVCVYAGEKLQRMYDFHVCHTIYLVSMYSILLKHAPFFGICFLVKSFGLVLSGRHIFSCFKLDSIVIPSDLGQIDEFL